MAERTVGRPPVVTAGEVIAAADALLRREGMAAVTMRRLGRDLGINPMVAYRLFPSKEHLLDAVFDRVVERASPRTTDDPLADVLQAFGNFYRDLVAHPGLLPLVAPRVLASRASISPFEWTLRRLIESGQSLDDATTMYMSLLAFTLGSAAMHPAVQQYDGRIDLAELSAREHPTASRLSVPLDYEAAFDAGLQSLIGRAGARDGEGLRS